MKILIISNGNILDYDFHLKYIHKVGYDKIICADGGAVHAFKMGIIPDFIVGDLDSITTDVYKFYSTNAVKFIKYPTHKDKTDTHIALEYALKYEPRQVDMFGCIGNRLDHTYANIMLMIKPCIQGITIRMINEFNEIFLSNGVVDIKGKKGEIISLLPIQGDVFIEKTIGLHYPINNRILPMQFPYGISNYLEDNTAQIVLKKGLLLIIKVRE